MLVTTTNKKENTMAKKNDTTFFENTTGFYNINKNRNDKRLYMYNKNGIEKVVIYF